MARSHTGALLALLVGCGAGGGKGSPAPGPEPPPASQFTPAPASPELLGMWSGAASALGAGSGSASPPGRAGDPESPGGGSSANGNGALPVGCPAVAVTNGYGRLKVTLEGDVLFDFDKHQLKASAQSVLATIKRRLIDKHPKARLVVEGHTDSVGPDAYNEKLSRRRAASVASWLTSHGVAAPRVSQKGYGERYPRVPNDSDESRAKNRRVEIVIIDDAAKKPPIAASGCKGALACCELHKQDAAARCVGKIQPMDRWSANLAKHKLRSTGGALSLSSCTQTRSPAVWITSTNENKIAKLDEHSGRELFRVHTYGRFPHRTAVAQDGSVWVTNRESGSYVHIATDGRLLCSSRYDTCMTRAAAVDSDGNAWVGCYNAGVLVKIDPQATDGTAKVKVDGKHDPELEVPRCKEIGRVKLKEVHPYGLVADGRGTLWTGINGGYAISHVDARKLEEIASINVTMDPLVRPRCWGPYGVSIDRDGNVWYANHHCGAVVKIDGRTGKVLAYSEPPRFKKPAAEIERILERRRKREEQRLEREKREREKLRKAGKKVPDPAPPPKPIPEEQDSELWEPKPYLRAAGIDLRGHAWLPDNRGDYVYEFASDGSFVKRVSLHQCDDGDAGLGALGTGSDSEGHMWTVLQSRGLVAEYTTDGTILGCYNRDKRFKSPYTYSDFTGSSMSMAANKDGRVRTRLSHSAPLVWRLVTLRAATLAGTRLCLRARTSGEWSAQHCIVGANVGVRSWELKAEHLAKSATLELELELGTTNPAATPIVYDLSVAGVE